MKPETRAMLEMLLKSDETISSDARFWFGELLRGRVPAPAQPNFGPPRKLVDAARELGVSDPTFSAMLKQLPLDLPREFWPQRLKDGLIRIPGALIWYFQTQCGVRYTPAARGRNGGRSKAA